MRQDINIIIYPYQSINRPLIQELIAKRTSFEIHEFDDIRDISVAVEAIERVIESQGLQYRVYDDIPRAIIHLDPLVPKATGFLGLIRTLAYITRGNKFSGYRLGKSFNTLSVIWQQ